MTTKPPRAFRRSIPWPLWAPLGALLCITAPPGLTYDKFDVQLCRATQDPNAQTDCFRALAPEQCRDMHLWDELDCWAEFAQDALPTKPKSLTLGRICQGAISVIMGRPIEIMETITDNGKIAYISYVRASDNTKWENKCRLEDKRILWGTVGGRWRHEDHISFSPNGKEQEFTVTEVFPGGGRRSKTFDY